MNDLELVRRACPDVDHLDPTTRAAIATQVFGSDAGSVVRPPVWPRRLVLVAAVVLVTVGLAVVADRSRTLAPVVPGRSTAPSTTAATPATTVEPTTTSTVPDLAAPRFRPPVDYGTKEQAAMTAYITRCLTLTGFIYHGPPYQTDSEMADHAASIEPGTYEAAYYGIGGSGGCSLEAAQNIFGLVRGDAKASNLEGQMHSTWTRTALTDPTLRQQLGDLAACARDHGITVHDIDGRPDKTVDDIVKGLDILTQNDPRLDTANGYVPNDILNAVFDDICPSYSTFNDALRSGINHAETDWIETNPQQMNALDAEFTDDLTRFQYIIDHSGQLPPG